MGPPGFSLRDWIPRELTWCPYPPSLPPDHAYQDVSWCAQQQRTRTREHGADCSFFFCAHSLVCALRIASPPSSGRLSRSVLGKGKGASGRGQSRSWGYWDALVGGSAQRAWESPASVNPARRPNRKLAVGNGEIASCSDRREGCALHRPKT